MSSFSLALKAVVIASTFFSVIASSCTDQKVSIK